MTSTSDALSTISHHDADAANCRNEIDYHRTAPIVKRSVIASRNDDGDHHNHRVQAQAVQTQAQAQTQQAVFSRIPCCVCGTMIRPNAANQCPACIASHIHLDSIVQTGPPGSPSTLTIYQCRTCQRYAQTPACTTYVTAPLESPELLALCVRHIPALNHRHKQQHNHTNTNSTNAASQNYKNHHSRRQLQAHGLSSSITRDALRDLQLIDAHWIWTEPHSQRLLLHLTVRATLDDKTTSSLLSSLSGLTIQQRFKVLLHVAWKMCPDCNRTYTNRTWQAVVQVRQQYRPPYTGKGGGSSLSQQGGGSGLQAIEKAVAQSPEMRKLVLSMNTVGVGVGVGSGSGGTTGIGGGGAANVSNHLHGFDFYFLTLAQAHTFVQQCVQRVTPLLRYGSRSSGSKGGGAGGGGVHTTSKVVSTDPNHTRDYAANIKYTLACELVPVQVYDLILIHKAAKHCKLAGHLVYVTRVSSSTIHLIDAAPALRRRLISSTTTSTKSTNKPTHTRKSRNHHHYRGSSRLSSSMSSSSSSSSSSSLFHVYTMELGAETYSKNERYFRHVLASHRLTRFVVLDVEWFSLDLSAVGPPPPAPQKNESQQEQVEEKEEKDEEEDEEEATRGDDPTVATAASDGNDSNNNTTGSCRSSHNKEEDSHNHHLHLHHHNHHQTNPNNVSWAQVVLARESDLGHNDTTLQTVCCSPLGQQAIRSGDVVLGYDLVTLNADIATTTLGDEPYLHARVVIPDVVVVQKVVSPSTASSTSSCSLDEISQHHHGLDHNDHDHDDPDHDDTFVYYGGEKPAMTKKKARRCRRKEGKRSKELQATVARMGFLTLDQGVDDESNGDDLPVGEDVDDESTATGSGMAQRRADLANRSNANANQNEDST